MVATLSFLKHCCSVIDRLSRGIFLACNVRSTGHHLIYSSLQIEQSNDDMCSETIELRGAAGRWGAAAALRGAGEARRKGAAHWNRKRLCLCF
jgi:hypothetical protein